jgi:hypothetical protein
MKLGLTDQQIVEIHQYGEPAGTRTQDPVIKSHVLYRLSYGLLQKDRATPCPRARWTRV